MYKCYLLQRIYWSIASLQPERRKCRQKTTEKKICTTERKMDGFVGSYGLHCKMMKKWTGRHHADYVDSETQFVLFKITQPKWRKKKFRKKARFALSVSHLISKFGRFAFDARILLISFFSLQQVLCCLAQLRSRYHRWSVSFLIPANNEFWNAAKFPLFNNKMKHHRFNEHKWEKRWEQK